MRLKPPTLSDVGATLWLLKVVPAAHYRESVPAPARGKTPEEQARFWATWFKPELYPNDVALGYALERLVGSVRLENPGSLVSAIRARAAAYLT